MIQVCRLVKRYGDHTAVDDLSFTAQEGKVYGFLGPNGAGKSTTMNMMTGYLSPTSGEVVVDGHSMARDPERAKAAIGYLPEQPPLYTDMTVEEYLTFAARLKGVPGKKVKGEVDRASGLAQLEDVRHRLIANLSKGYRQRVGLAQAVMGTPKVIILDEPTVGLDPKQILEIRALIRDLAREHTVILSSHILSEVQEVCDQVLILHHGRLLASGTPRELERKLVGTSLEVTLAGEPQRCARLLAQVPGVARVFPGEQRSGESTFTLEVEGEADPRAEVFQCCAQNQTPLLMMRPAGLSLEHIFLKLTDDSHDPLLSGIPGAGEGQPQAEAPAEPEEGTQEAPEDGAQETGEEDRDAGHL